MLAKYEDWRDVSFNPRAREGRDRKPAVIRHGTCVSIHAPARGATRTRVGQASGGDVSIHAPARGATRWSGRWCLSFWFQSTRPRGARPGFGRFDKLHLIVSIHAPARGATHKFEGLLLDVVGSIHAPARGATEAVPAGRVDPEFQSTRPRGARPRRHDTRPRFWQGFNPRAREGRDGSVRNMRQEKSGFNPRAREGRDLVKVHSCAHWHVSIHAPARGATRQAR